MTAERVVREHVYYDNDTAEGGQICPIINIHGQQKKRIYEGKDNGEGEERDIL